MKTLAIICYVIGACLLTASCFTTGVSLIWWLGGAAVVFLIAGCIFQFNEKKTSSIPNAIHISTRDTASSNMMRF